MCALDEESCAMVLAHFNEDVEVRHRASLLPYILQIPHNELNTIGCEQFKALSSDFLSVQPHLFRLEAEVKSLEMYIGLSLVPTQIPVLYEPESTLEIGL